MRLPIFTASIVALTVVLISIHSLGLDYAQASESYTFLSQRGSSANRIITQYIEDEIGDFSGDFSLEDADRVEVINLDIQELLEELDLAFYQGNRENLIDVVTRLNPYIEEVQQLRDIYSIIVPVVSSVDNTEVQKEEVEVSASADSGVVSTEMTYYADFFDGRTAANGETFYNNNWFSAAKCDVAFNTLTQAMYDNKSVLLHINDRPHCVKHPDVLDLSQETFLALASKSVGRLYGSQKYLREAPADFYKHFFAFDAFSEDGIDLERDIPNMYLEGETFVLSGERGSCLNDIVLSITDPVGNTYDIGNISDTDDCSFRFAHNLAVTGSYIMSIEVPAAGISFPEMEIKTYSPDWFEGKVLFSSTVDTSVISFSRRSISSGGSYIEFSESELFYQVTTNAGVFFGVGSVLLPSDSTTIESIEVSRTSTGYSHDMYEDMVELSI